MFAPESNRFARFEAMEPSKDLFLVLLRMRLDLPHRARAHDLRDGFPRSMRIALERVKEPVVLVAGPDPHGLMGSRWTPWTCVRRRRGRWRGKKQEGCIHHERRRRSTRSRDNGVRALCLVRAKLESGSLPLTSGQHRQPPASVASSSLQATNDRFGFGFCGFEWSDRAANLSSVASKRDPEISGSQCPV
ncbi:hypothetical protein PsorP6_011467 [Peronosclerospora sorghi]|uniref:Uncharacterized protein n=1 Tax=Peronosclerospora sorghi TaxID=230839 RepID=A0ACC0WI21_9STRA|nr:hypothetical protein PsorP6_011467 [Peronosclerospora sorghi]